MIQKILRKFKKNNLCVIGIKFDYISDSLSFSLIHTGLVYKYLLCYQYMITTITVEKLLRLEFNTQVYEIRNKSEQQQI